MPIDKHYELTSDLIRNHYLDKKWITNLQIASQTLSKKMLLPSDAGIDGNEFCIEVFTRNETSIEQWCELLKLPQKMQKHILEEYHNSDVRSMIDTIISNVMYEEDSLISVALYRNHRKKNVVLNTIKKLSLKTDIYKLDNVALNQYLIIASYIEGYIVKTMYEHDKNATQQLTWVNDTWKIEPKRKFKWLSKIKSKLQHN